MCAIDERQHPKTSIRSQLKPKKIVFSQLQASVLLFLEASITLFRSIEKKFPQISCDNTDINLSSAPATAESPVVLPPT